jgi:hypothetical protein
MSNQVTKPPKGSPKHKEESRTYIIEFWHGEPRTVIAWDKSEANGLIASQILKERRLPSFNAARREIKSTRLAPGQSRRRGPHAFKPDKPSM